MKIRQNGSLSCRGHFSRDADIGLVGLGPTKADAFRQAAIALTDVVTSWMGESASAAIAPQSQPGLRPAKPTERRRECSLSPCFQPRVPDVLLEGRRLD